jgi:hypothetical protein
MGEGAKAYLIRVTNDDMAGPGPYAETVSANARDMKALSAVLGVERTFDLNYNNHMMDNIARSELRARFIFLFRLLKSDIVVTYDPWGQYEENPDHYVTSACVEAAAWMAGGAKDYPEHPAGEHGRPGSTRAPGSAGSAPSSPGLGRCLRQKSSVRYRRARLSLVFCELYGHNFGVPFSLIRLVGPIRFPCCATTVRLRRRVSLDTVRSAANR